MKTIISTNGFDILVDDKVMSWDLSSEEVICDKLESQQTVILAFSKKIIMLEHELKYAKAIITEIQADKFEARAIIKELEAKLKLKDEEVLCCAENWADDQKKLQVAVEALEYTQRTDARIGHTDETEDGVLRGMPDKIMMRNRCKTALEKIRAK